MKLALISISIASALCMGGYSGNAEAAPTATSTKSALPASANVLDPALIPGMRANYTILKTASGVSIADHITSDGINFVANNLRLQFADTSIALDTDGNAGKVYRLYQAAFNHAPDLGGLGFWISTIDRNVSLSQIAGGFLDSAEFRAAYGDNLSAETFITKIYTNVLHRAPDQGGYDYWLGALKRGESRANVLAYISESAENKVATNGAIQNGIEFTPMPIATAAAGVWEGNSDDGRKLAGIVLDNGSFWFFYSRAGSATQVGGILAGMGRIDSGSTGKFTSTGMANISLEGQGVQSANLSANASAMSSFNGNVISPAINQSFNFTTKYNTQFSQAPSLATLAGNYFGLGTDKTSAQIQTLRIDANGVITGSSLNGCKLTGTISVRPNIGVYNLSLSFGGTPCATQEANRTLTGLAYLDVPNRQLTAFSLNNKSDGGFIFVGFKP